MVQHGRQILFGLVSAAILVVVIAFLSNQVGSSSALQAASTSQALELDASSPTSLPVQGPHGFFARGLSVVADVSVVGIQITGEKSVRVNLRYFGGSESSPSVTVVLTGPRLSGSVANIQVSKAGTDLNMDLLGDGGLLPAKPVSVLVVRSS